MKFRLLKTRETIAWRIAELARSIANDCEDKNIEDLLVVPVLDGAMMFCMDLIRHLPSRLMVEVRPVRVKSYQGINAGSVSLNTLPSIAGRNVLLLEDIVDSGKTLDHLLPMLKAQNPLSFSSCCLFAKGRTKHEISYRGFEIEPNKFVIGSGLDFNGFYRNLPDLYWVEEE